MALDRGGVRRKQPMKPVKRSRLGQQGLPVYVKPDKGDPIGGFLGAVKDVVTFGNDEVVGVAKKVYKTEKEHLSSQIPGTGAWGRRQKRERRLAQRGTPVRNTLDVSPGKLTQLTRAAAAHIDRPGWLDLDELVSRIPKGEGPTGSSKVYFAPRGPSTADQPVNRRIPWLVHTKTGEVRVGAPGHPHAWVYPRGGKIDEWKQGWLYNPTEDFAHLQLKRTPAHFSVPEQQGVYQLLRLLFGQNSPITDDMVHMLRGLES